MQGIINGYMGFQGLAAGSAIFATGQGLQFAGSTLTGWGDPNDTIFARQLYDQIVSNYCVDGARVFSAGFSFGAIMSNRVGCELGDVVTAIAPGSGAGPAPAVCRGNSAVWITHGNTDGIVPYTSGQDSLNHWIAHNRCSQDTIPTGVDACVEYQGCVAGAPVVWCPTRLGHVPPSYYLSEAWAFFNRF
jgi:poly(3-hydroxybutyrate) depolymerase